MGCGENRILHMNQALKNDSETKTEPNPKAVLWQLKKLHIPKRKNIFSLEPSCLHKQYTTSSNPPQT
jgi:hypothetical protein